jgi:hypothetical protein
MRRLFVIFLALALTAGLVMHSVPTGNHQGKPGVMTGMSMETTTDMPMPCEGNGCADDEKGLMPAACAAFCSSVVALPVMLTFFDAPPIGAVWPPEVAVLNGFAGPPDPYPPRPIRMS